MDAKIKQPGSNDVEGKGQAQTGGKETPHQTAQNTIESGVDEEQQRLAAADEVKRLAWKQQGEAAKPAQPQSSEKPATDNIVESDEIFTARKADIKPIMPPEIEKQYLRVGDKYYHPKNTDSVAFEDKGNKLETKSNSENIAESMVRIAEARGWDEIKVSGSETFRREAWLEAASRGMHVKGYSPTQQDKVALAGRVGTTEAEKPEGKDKQFRARENAVEDKGHEKKLAQTFATVPAADAAQQHPELAPAYATVAAIEKQAEADGMTPQQRAIVMARVKQNVINSIERGEIPEVKVKETVEVTRDKEAELSR